ncbi:MAG TPA: hypothetical protein VEC11_00245 [Allosphingosinicella sp.]|nr:hypothetical protein [Allosphingosinicella sp.]
MPNRPVPLRWTGAALAILALGACVPRSAQPAPTPTPAPRPVPLPPPPPPPAPPPADWTTGPLSPGDWTYSPLPDAALASFRSDRATFTIRCQQDRTIWLALSGAQADALTIRTSYGVRRLPATRVDLNEMLAAVPVNDPLLEQMAFSRGRFLVTVEGGPSLVVPAWPEVGRVIEDCRGQ